MTSVKSVWIAFAKICLVSVLKLSRRTQPSIDQWLDDCTRDWIAGLVHEEDESQRFTEKAMNNAVWVFNGRRLPVGVLPLFQLPLGFHFSGVLDSLRRL